MIEEYVLKPFTEDELKSLPDIIATACDAVTTIITSGIHPAMNKYHCVMNNKSIEEG